MDDETVADKRTWKVRFLDKLHEGAAHVVMYGAGGIVLISVGTLFFHALNYLKTGEWANWNLFDLLSRDLPASFLYWIVNPEDWQGLSKIVAWVLIRCPIELSVFGLAVVWFFGGMMFLNWLQEVTKAAKDNP